MKRILVLVLLNTIVFLVLGIVTDHFFTKSNIIVIVDNMAFELMILSVYTLLLVGGYFDLSTDGIVALSGIITGLMMSNGVNWVISVIFGLMFGTMVGFINGIIVVKLEINGLIATLTTWWICLGISLGLTKAIAIFGFPDGFQALGQTRFLDFRVTIIPTIILILVSAITLDFTKLGANIYTMGSNKIVAGLMGIPIIPTGIFLYSLVGLVSGSVGILLASKLNAASSLAVDGMVLRLVAAAVIGGATLNGGKGSVIGSVLGLVLMTLLSNAMIHLGISPYWQKAVVGGILLTVVLLERLNTNKGV